MAKSSVPYQIILERFDWQWNETDKDANFKQEMKLYTREDPMPTIETMSRNLGIPIGAIVKYVLVKWANMESSTLLEIGPEGVRQMADMLEHAESVGTDEERLRTYRKLSHFISWLRVPLTDPDWRPGGRD